MFYAVFSDVSRNIYMRCSIMYLAMFYVVFSDVSRNIYTMFFNVFNDVLWCI
jgi:hypothetical protein